MITSGAVTGRVNRLVAAGFAVRTPSSEDGRVMAVTATASGIAFAAELARSLTQSRLHRAITSLGKKRMDELKALLTSIDDQLAD
jgi:DNA-binding MarR family transcriptional regulator